MFVVGSQGRATRHIFFFTVYSENGQVANQEVLLVKCYKKWCLLKTASMFASSGQIWDFLFE